MRALCWHGTGDVRVDTVPDPKIADPTDCIVRITSTAICGSDLHLYDGFMPTMQAGDGLSHEPMSEVVEVGAAVKKLRKGNRVVVSFCIACGGCWFCEHQLFSCCDVSNPNREVAAKVMGHSPAPLFGYSHMLGGFAGGQAEFLRVPYAGPSGPAAAGPGQGTRPGPHRLVKGERRPSPGRRADPGPAETRRPLSARIPFED